ncbi:MAG: B12-binding domain-containing radical SAM protein [Candidatus Krumholzibacteriia bacterium]
MNILLVSPRTPDTFWSFKHALPFVAKRSSLPPLGLLTVAGLLPRAWHLELVDLDVSRLRDAQIRRADWVLVSAMIVHEESVREIVRRCAALDRPVIGGGPLFTTGHERFPEVAHFVLGEAEELAGELAADLAAGQVRHIYRASRFPDLALTPIPRWDLINPRHYATLSVQASRGCPYDCEFCDIVVMNGRVPRVKTPERMIAELAALRARGWGGGVFIVDDNFIGNRARVKEMLRAIIAWRRRTRSPFTFITEASVNLADDAELLALMVEAGFKKVFLGLETPVADSLVECRKSQNTGRDLVAAVRTIQAAGLEVMGGFIIGFDNDQDDIFERQFEFIQKAGVATAMVGLLTALPQTRLWKRLAGEGRLLGESTGDNTSAAFNFVPRLDREYLMEGYRRLMQRLYEPRAYYRRVGAFLETYRAHGPRPRLLPAELGALFKSLLLNGLVHRGRRAYWRFLGTTLVRRPSRLGLAVTAAIYGHHFRTVARRL